MKTRFRFILPLIMSVGFYTTKGQSVIIDGSVLSKPEMAIRYKDYWAELRSDDSILIEKQRINTAGNFTFQLMFAHNYYLSVQSKTEVLWRLLVRNKMEYGTVHYPVSVEIPPPTKEKDVYEVTFDSKGDKLYLKNGMPITEITYQFETSRRDSSEIIKK